MNGISQAILRVGLIVGLVLLGVWIGRSDELAPWLTRLNPGAAATNEQAAVESADSVRKPLYYRNPMGLPDVSPVPKKDSMGMDYIPVYEEDAQGSSSAIKVSLDKVQRIGVRTEPAQRRLLQRSIRATGTVVPNERTLAVVTVKFPGFVEALSVQTTGAEVRAGEPLMRVWVENAELLRKQVDLVLAMRGTAGTA